MSSDPRIRSFITVAIMAVGVFGGMAAGQSELEENVRRIILVISIAAIIVGLILHFILVRCPHCGRWIRRPYGEYCRYCGKKYSDDDSLYDEDKYNIPENGSW